MTKILVVSDSHGNTVALDRIVAIEHPFDCLVHCGDGVGDLFRVDLPEGVTVVRVSGNIDIARGGDFERVAFFTMDGVRFMVAHGDQFRVNHEYTWIAREGRRNGADVVLFGHTHGKYHHRGRPVLFNPGPASGGQYGLIRFGESVRFEHRRLEE